MAVSGAAPTGRACRALSNLPTVPPQDPSNSHSLDRDAAALGKLFYFDPRVLRLSAGGAGRLDRPAGGGRARTPKGEPTNLSCASCHDPTHAGTDDTSVPNTVSIGAGIYDVNGQQT